MPKRIAEVDKHPQKEKIIKALVKGTSFREITGQYGISKSSLSRYLNDSLFPRVAKHVAERDMKDAKFVLSEIDSIISKMKKLYDACDEYLTDPDNPDKYSLMPRAWEQEIKYLDYSNVSEENPKPEQKTMMVQDLIDEMRDHKKELIEIKYKHHDPRKIITETATVMTKQLELLARIQGTIKDVSINIINTSIWVEVQNALLMVTEKFPQIREDLAKELAKIGGKG